MSLEHIFRNLNDIRVFDELSSSQIDEDSSLYFEDIMDMLDLPQREEIQIRDSIEHLVRQHIIGIKYSEEETKTGCNLCKLTDELGFPRYSGHESHKPEIVIMEKIEKYYLLRNKLNFCLTSAVMEASFIFAEELMNKEK